VSQVLFLMATALAGCLATGRFPAAPSPVTGRTRSIVPYALALGLAFIVHASAIAYAAFTQVPYPPWLVPLWLVPILETAPLFAHTVPAVSITLELVSIAETVLLTALVFAARGRTLGRSERIVAFSVFAAMAAYALLARGTASSDLYAYIADARLGFACYAGNVTLADGPFRAVEYFWGHPPIPCAYGPVWTWLVHVTIGALRDTHSAIVAMRLLSLGSFVAMLAALRRLDVGAAFVVALALDPAMLLQYVADGHNDLFSVALVLWARQLAVRHNVLGALVLAAAAGASKVAFLPIAMLAFVDAPQRNRRIAYALAAVAGGVFLSLVFGGAPYLHALLVTTQIYPAALQPGGAILPRVATFAIVATIGFAIVRRRTAWPASWGFASLGSVIFPWYFAWGIPYAALDAIAAWPFLVSLPIVMFLNATTYADTVLVYPLIIALPIVGVLFAYASARRVVPATISST